MSDGLIFSVYMVGVAASFGAMSAIGLRNPSALGDSFSGDHALDFVLSIFWPFFWPLYLAFRLDRLLAGGGW